MNPALKILFVPRWYPCLTDPMPGLFIQRQAEALAKKYSVQVISVHPDPACTKKYEIVNSIEKSVKVCRVYYRTIQNLPAFSKLVNFFHYVKAHHLGYMSLEPFSADIINGHILTREIFFAWYMAGKQNRPYVISEHWSRYFPANGTYHGLFRKWLTGFLIKKSSGLIAVSDSLAMAMKAVNLVHRNTVVVPNLVDVSVFIPPINKPAQEKAVIMHVSCFEDKSKNISGFLEAIAGLYKQRSDFRVILVGDGPDYLAMRKFAFSLGLNDAQVEFTGLKQHSELIMLYQTASFVVQTSRYETFGTVVIEALSCGLPVVSTNTGVAASVINDSNGIIIQQSSVNEIVMAIKHMLNIYSTFDSRKLHESVAGNFSEDAISEQLTGIYLEIINTWRKD